MISWSAVPIILAMFLASGVVWAQTQDVSADVREILKREEKILDALDDLDRKMADVRSREDAAQKKKGAQAKKITETEVAIRDTEARTKRLRIVLRDRLRARADLRLDDAIWRRLLLSSESPNELIRRRQYLRRILKHDLGLLGELRRETKALKRLRTVHREAAVEVNRLAGALAEHRSALERQHHLRSDILGQLKGKRSLLDAVLKRRAKLRAGVPVNSSDSSPSSGLRKGRLLRPTIGQLLTRFGTVRDEQLRTAIQSNGWSVMAPIGSPARAIADGKVVFSGWYTGFGRFVIMDHGAQHHSLYAHLYTRSVRTGDTVEQGELVGLVGQTGSLKGPQLYFEIRVGGQPVDPAPWFQKTP